MKQSNHTVSDPRELTVVVMFGTFGFGCYLFVCKMELKVRVSGSDSIPSLG